MAKLLSVFFVLVLAEGGLLNRRHGSPSARVHASRGSLRPTQADTTYLITFDSAKGTTFDWQLVNDPVMGGRSNSTWYIDTNDNPGKSVFDGYCAIVPQLQAPGFCNARTTFRPGNMNFNDVSRHTHLLIRATSTTPEYKGYKVSFAANTLNPTFKSFKADFEFVQYDEPREWQTIAVPFNQFSDEWSPATGEPTKKCSDDPKVCPTENDLRNIEQFGLWAEGVEGHFHLETLWIGAGSPETWTRQPIISAVYATEADWINSCKGIPQDNLLYNVTSLTEFPFALPEDETLIDAVCCDRRFAAYAEPQYSFDAPTVDLYKKLNPSGTTTFYDTVCGIPLFTAPIGRSFAQWHAEAEEHGWPSFRSQEVHMENIKLGDDGEVISSCGTHLGSNLPDENGDRYCIDLVCISGQQTE